MSFQRTIFPAAVFISLGIIMQASGSVASETIQNISPRPHGAPPGSLLADLSSSIATAASELNWHGVAHGDGFVDLLIVVRAKHEATVRVGFDSEKFWIDYLDSVNLDYNPNDLVHFHRRNVQVIGKGPRIHRNYNKWVDALANRITVRVSHLLKRTRPAVERPSTLLVADEIDKLNALRQRGVLTDEEFQRQKERLLAY